MTGPGSHLSLCIVSCGTEKGQGVGSSCKTSKPAPDVIFPPAKFHSQGLMTSQNNATNWGASLRGCFVLKPQQSEDRKLGLWNQGLGSVSCELNELPPPQCCDVPSPKQQGQPVIETTKTVGEN